MAETIDRFAPWLARWGLTADGAVIHGPVTGNPLLPVRRGETLAMLKLAGSAQEQLGGAVMAWWAGQGAAPVLAHEGEALLMLRGATDEGLVRLAHAGRDAEATGVLCGVAAALHAPRRTAPPAGLRTLRRQFRALEERAGLDPRLAAGWRLAEGLLAAPSDEVVLHGDLHHRNVLDFGPLGWLAIDGWGVIGERGYDYANIPRNPDVATALAPGRLRSQVRQIAGLAGLDAQRLFAWTAAHSCLSTAWLIEDGMDPADGFAIAEAALAEAV